MNGPCAALARAITLGWLLLHESGTYVKFTPAGAERPSSEISAIVGLVRPEELGQGTK
jgi:hypothetical protein